MVAMVTMVARVTSIAMVTCTGQAAGVDHMNTYSHVSVSVTNTGPC